MIALDTNVIVRLVTLDNEAEVARAARLVAENDVFVGATVILETAWVLRKTYGMSQVAISGAVQAFAGLPRVTLQSAEEVRRALAWADQGMDIADALHLSLANEVGALATFDQNLVRQAQILSLDVVEP